MVVTDHTLHQFWAQPRVRRFFVANDAMATELQPRVPGRSIAVTGIPVSPRFSAPPPREEARQALGIDPHRPTVVIMGGGIGHGVDAVAAAVTAAEVRDLQVLAICGRNAAARQALQSISDGDRLRVLGFVNDVERYFAAADVVITKPGGLTTSEVLAVGRPMILTRPIPGQEEGNARMMCGFGAALTAASPDAARAIVERSFTDPGVLPRMAAAAARHGRPNAAAAIAQLVLAEGAEMPAAA